MTAAALKIPSAADAQQAQAAVRALSGVLRRKSARTIKVQSEGTKDEVSVTVWREIEE